MVPEESLACGGYPLDWSITGKDDQIEPDVGRSKRFDTVLAGDAVMIDMAEVGRIGVAGPVQAGIDAIFKSLGRTAGESVVIMKCWQNRG